MQLVGTLSRQRIARQLDCRRAEPLHTDDRGHAFGMNAPERRSAVRSSRHTSDQYRFSQTRSRSRKPPTRNKIG